MSILAPTCFGAAGIEADALLVGTRTAGFALLADAFLAGIWIAVFMLWAPTRSGTSWFVFFDGSTLADGVAVKVGAKLETTVLSDARLAGLIFVSLFSLPSFCGVREGKGP